MSMWERESLEFIKDKWSIRICREFYIFDFRTGIIFVENAFLLNVMFQPLEWFNILMN